MAEQKNRMENLILFHKYKIQYYSCTYFFDVRMGIFIWASALREKKRFIWVFCYEKYQTLIKTVKKIKSGVTYLATYQPVKGLKYCILVGFLKEYLFQNSPTWEEIKWLSDQMLFMS